MRKISGGNRGRIPRITTVGEAVIAWNNFRHNDILRTMAIRDSELANSIIRNLGEKLTAIREIVGKGEVNHVFVVSVAAARQCVVRFCRDPLDDAHYAKEAWCFAAARRNGVPVPELIATGRFEGVPFIVQTFVEGPNADLHRSAELWRLLGAYAQKINDIRLDDSAPDDLYGRFGRDPQASWLAHVKYNLDQLTSSDPLIRRGVYGHADQHRLSACFDALRERVTEFGLSHGDLVPKNNLLPPNGQPTLIDWGSAGVGPRPFLDYMRIWTDPANENFSAADLEAFADGYGIATPDLISTIADIHLLSQIDLVRWALDKRPDRLREISTKATVAVSSWLADTSAPI